MSSTPQSGAAGQGRTGGEPQAASGGPRWRPEWGTGPQNGALSPVPEHQTRVTGRRVAQYIADAVLVSIIPSAVFWAIGDRGTGALHVIGVLIAAVIGLVVMLWYWVIRPYGANGQTFAMQWFGVRVISEDGGRASMGQLLVRWILLLIDTIFAGLLGLLVIVCSRYRQRVGDHVARTLVVRMPRRAAGQHTAAARSGPAGDR